MDLPASVIYSNMVVHFNLVVVKISIATTNTKLSWQKQVKKTKKEYQKTPVFLFLNTINTNLKKGNVTFKKKNHLSKLFSTQMKYR